MFSVFFFLLDSFFFPLGLLLFSSGLFSRSVSNLQDQCKAMNERVLASLTKTPNGAKFAQDIQQVLARESRWQQWKTEKCPTFVVCSRSVLFLLSFSCLISSSNFYRSDCSC
jgi:hypothetical protein